MDKYVVRQPIKNATNDKIIGYELMFQSDDEGLFNSPEASVADTMAGFLMQNNDKIFSDRKTFITVTPSLLFRNTPKIFEKDKIVIQIDDNLIVHPLANAIIKRYCAEGYHFAINDFQFSPHYFNMLEYMEYVKVNIRKQDKVALDNIVRMMKSFGKKCIATGITTKEYYELAKELNVDLLEGSYIADNLLSKTKKMEFLQGNFFKLVVAVTQDEPNIEDIEVIISRDVSLSYAILKMVNSAYFALRKKISSIRQAVVTLGIGQLKQWVYLMSFSEEDNNTSEEIMKLSFLRATFASSLVEHIRNFPISKPEAYMMGMFSTLDYMIDAPLEEILQDIPIIDEVKRALLVKEGDPGKLFQLILCYEQADWKSIKELVAYFQIPANVIAQLYINCVEEVNLIWEGLTNGFERL
ncbi:MAG: HDOD domain-containing protein [Lachnospiraceae bacterium]|nr:HDOD domain-containing protein [Lachnospiraceae bacterium]